MPREWLRNSVLPLQPLEPESEIWGVGGRIYREPPPSGLFSAVFRQVAAVGPRRPSKSSRQGSAGGT